MSSLEHAPTPPLDQELFELIASQTDILSDTQIHADENNTYPNTTFFIFGEVMTVSWKVMSIKRKTFFNTSFSKSEQDLLLLAEVKKRC